MFKIRKRVLVAILAVVLFFIGITAYVNLILIPIQLRQLLISKAEETLGRKVSLEDIHFSFARGLILRGIRIAEADNPDSTMLKTDELALNFVLINFFVKKQIIIPSIRISGLEAHLSRSVTGQWNIADLLNKPASTQSNEKNGWNVLVRKIILEKSSLQLRDSSTQPTLEESIQDITAEAAISLKPGIQFTLSLNIPSEQTSLTLKGNYLLKDKELFSEISLKSLALDKYVSLLPPSINGIYQKGRIEHLDITVEHSPTQQSIQGNVETKNVQIKFNENTVAGDLKITGGSLEISNSGLSGKGQINAQNLQASLSQDQSISGNLNAEITSFNLQGPSLAFQGNLAFQDGHWKKSDGSSLSGDFLFDKISFTGEPKAYTGNGQLTAKNLNAKIIPDKSATGTLSINNLSIENKDDAWNINGDAQLASASIKIADQYSFEGDLLLPKTKILYTPSQITVNGQPEWQNASANFGSNRSYKGSIKLAAISAVSDGHEWIIKTNGRLNTDTLIFDNTKFTGSPDFNLSLSANQENNTLNYSGDITFHNAALDGIPTLNQINSIQGKITFSPNHLETDQLKLTTQNTQLLVKGYIDDFLKPRGDLEISTENIVLNEILASFPEIASKINYTIEGGAAVRANYRGLLADPQKAEISAAVDLKNTSISGGNIPGDGIKNMTGLVHYDKDLASWKNLSGNFAGKNYTLNGQISNFSKPVLETSLTSDGVNITTQLNILNKAFQIISLKGQYLQSTFDIKGDVRLQDASGPRLDLRLSSQLNLEDLKNFPQLKEKITPIDPKGSLEISGLFRGIPNEWRDWQVVLDVKSPKVSLYKYPLDNLSIHLEQRDKFISQFTLISNIYSGALDIKGSADLSDPLVAVDGKLLLQNLNLSQLAKDQSLKIQDLQGDLSLAVNLKGPALDQKAWEGGGAATISNGYLGQWGLLKGIFGTLMIIDEFKTVYVTDASVNFLIRDRKISTENLLLNSKIATLTGRGWVDFDQNLHFDISPTLSEIVLAQSESLKKNATAFLSQAANVQCSGTLTQPDCKLENTPFKILETTTDILKEGVQGILQEIF